MEHQQLQRLTQSQTTTQSPEHSKSYQGASGSKGGSLGPDFAIEKITPELAAKIVKHFVLPMFDNAPSAKLGKRLGHKQNIAQSGSIYNELKLSDQLNSTLEKVRSEV